jgi:hypothetical protein
MRLALNVLYRLMFFFLHYSAGFFLMSPRELMNKLVSVCAWMPIFLLIDGIHIGVLDFYLC